MQRASILLIEEICGERKIEAVSVKINDVEMNITDGIRKCQLDLWRTFLFNMPKSKMILKKLNTRNTGFAPSEICLESLRGKIVWQAVSTYSLLYG